MTDPLVSIIIPLFNAVDWIETTIASACAQTYRAIEIIVVDDGSTDASPDKVAAMARRDHRIRLIMQDNGGVARARNKGLDAASGAFIATLDADDIWAPRKIELQLAALLAGPADAALAYNWYRRIGPDGRVLGTSPYPRLEGHLFHRHLEWNFISNGSTPLVRTDVARSIGFDPGLRDAGSEGCEDYLFQLQVAHHHSFLCVPHFLTGYRQLPGSMGSSAERMTRSHLAMFARIAGDAPTTAQPVIARRRAELHLALANMQARRKSPRSAHHLFAAIKASPAATARTLLARASRGRTLPFPAGTIGEAFDTCATDQRDGEWATLRSGKLLAALHKLDRQMSVNPIKPALVPEPH
ncbi:Glycosyltransferase [Sphingobium yanoikuyae]|uniref:Glycosyltransferase n=1 Tax=Sphingobium yanoikuyae TaxID=13690 RepID=A0A084EBE1_SPHYA|nr:glycosyltransferase family 2 protein [Sphingobium yanoikuyae]KEZ15283.1 Glycosyltransferase [Sphingobium yanoikuyae]